MPTPPRTTRVWLARHAESADPTVFHGAESDVELGSHGVRQALAAVEFFRGCQPTLMVSSAMKRAIATAAPTASALNIPHLIMPEFHERRVGQLGGTRFDLAGGPWAATLQRWQAGDTAYTTPGAESFDELRTRLVHAWETLITRHAGERIVLVTHGVVVKVLLLGLLPGWGPSRWSELGRVHNLAVSELVSIEGGHWQAASLLQVPSSVQAVNTTAESSRNRSEA